MKKKQVKIWVAVVVVIIIAYFSVNGIKTFLDLKKYQKQVEEIKIINVDISKVPDGTYTGSYEVLWVAAEVKVTVADQKIERIELLEHKNGRGSLAEVIPSKVVEAQSLEVDIISGATSSSKVILKAIENALTKGV